MVGDLATVPQAPPAVALGPALVTPAPGTLVAGKYRVEGPLGEGGMGVVLRAHHVTLDEPVALKLLKPIQAVGAEAVERFVREARASAKVKNEHIVTVFDVGVHEGMPFLVMELVDGRGLGQLVEAEGPLEVSFAVDLLLQACDGMADAHARGIVHRDLKPNNLMLTRRGDGGALVKVLDFGLATAPTDEAGARAAAAITATHTTFGSPAYMPPEQIRAARDADARADIWALGVILYELVSGQLPFNGPTVQSVLAAIVADPPRSLVAVKPELGALWPVIERCLRKAPEERFASVSDLAAALAPFASPEGALVAARAQRRRPATGSLSPPLASPPLDATLAAPGPQLPSATSAMAASTDAVARPSASRAWMGLVAVGVVVVVLGGAVARRRPWARVAERRQAESTVMPPPAVAAPVSPSSAPAGDAPAPPRSSAAPAVSASAQPARLVGRGPGRAGGAGARGVHPSKPATSDAKQVDELQH